MGLNHAMDNFQDVLLSYFRAHPLVGLILPDGWFGRPYDSILEYQSVQAVRGNYLLNFDGGESIEIVGNPVLVLRERSLFVSEFEQVDWRWVSYGSSQENHSQYVEGEVVFMG